MKTQTAVEWLIEQIKSKADSLPYNTKENRMAKGIYVDCLIMAKQALEMEKEQIIDFQLYMSENEFISNHLWDFEDMAIKFLNSQKQDL